MTTSCFRLTGFHSDLGLRHFERAENCPRKIGQHLICLPFFPWSVNWGQRMLGFKYLGQLRRSGQHFGFIARYRAILKSRSLMLCFSSRNGRFRVISSSLYCVTESILPPGVISTSLSGLWLRFKVITSALKIEGSQDHPNTFNSKPLCKGHWKGFFWTDVYTCTQSFPNDILGCQQARKIWWRWQLFVHYLLQFLHRVKQKIGNCSRTPLVFLGHVKWVSKKSLTIPFVPLTNVNTSLFRGQWATVWSLFSPLDFHFWAERSRVSEQPHLFAASFFLCGWVTQSKHSPFCPTTLAASPIIAYHEAKSWP